MTATEIKMKLAGLLVTLAEETGPVPASSLYLALGSSMSDYQTVTGVGSKMGWIKVTASTLALTATGRVIAGKFAAAMVAK